MEWISMPEFQPVRFGKYLLLEKLATGGMAQLYRAKITGIEGFEKLIAIKMILPHLGKEKELISAFIDEAKLAALLNHQNIVQIYDFGSVEDTYFISMEYLFGNDLRAIWNKAREMSLPLSLEYALYVISRVCSGLAYAHELRDFQGRSLNIIHRDISPQNIFVTYQGDVKILDFGIAKAASQSTVTQYGMIKGKVAYMSPEQAAGKPVDQRSDIFSTGILLYELITNAKMFNGESTIQILTKVRDADYRSPRSIVGGLHAKVYGILDRALAKEPDQRYQTCSEMLADLEECIIELGLRPSARGLAQYMKALFESEMAAEDQVMREIGGSRKIEIVEIEQGQEDLAGKSETAAEVGRLALEDAQEKSQDQHRDKHTKKKTTSYAAFAAAIVMVVLAATIWYMGKHIIHPGKDITVAPGKVSAEKSTQKAPVSVTHPEVKNENLVKADALLKQAVALVDKDPKKARSMLLEVLRLDPGSVHAHFRLGSIYVKLKDYPRAIENYEKAAELDPQFPDIYFNLGFAYAMNKNYAKAEEMYGRVVTMRPRYLDEALFNLAVVQEKLGKRGECLANLERARTINPKNEVVRQYLAKTKANVKKGK